MSTRRPPMICPACGRDASGNFCSYCGARLEARSAEAGAPGAAHEGADAGASGTAPVPARKPFLAQLPWILSGLALVAFAVAITLFVQNQTSARLPGMPPTGTVAAGPAAEAGPGAAGAPMNAGEPGTAGGMPTAAELAAMSPREAADRLFERAMRAQASGEAEQARFFAGMGIRAYGRLTPEEWDADARFHAGLLQLLTGNVVEARARAEEILDSAPDHLLGLALAARAAQAAGDTVARDAYYRDFLRARDVRAGAREARPGAPQGASGPDAAPPEYEAHAALLESIGTMAREVVGGANPE